MLRNVQRGSTWPSERRGAKLLRFDGVAIGVTVGASFGASVGVTVGVAVGVAVDADRGRGGLHAARAIHAWILAHLVSQYDAAK